MTELWRTKVAAWLHDPPEKAFVLFRTPGRGHEAGTVATLLRKLLDIERLEGELAEIVRKADRMAAAADRPDRPRPDGSRPGAWASDRISFPDSPRIVHPLSGDVLDLGSIEEVSAPQAESMATDHLCRCLGNDEDKAALKKAFLRLWRLAPELVDRPNWRSLWRLLPADTRVPDHAIWQHLGLVSALAGAMANGDDPALLLVTLGPVQAFIEQGRSTSDLWAGSHLVARLCWETMLPVVEQYGPDAMVFPALHGNPFCDAWLVRQGMMTVDELKKIRASWSRRSDAHPLFAASLPNRFLAIVPWSQGKQLAQVCIDGVRDYLKNKAKEAWTKIAHLAGLNGPGYAVEQIDKQVAGFPEIHWTLVRWPATGDDVLSGDSGQMVAKALVDLGTSDPRESTWWKVLSRSVTLSGAELYSPNPGVLYPAVVELAERTQAANRRARMFDQLSQVGYRCSLCGEREWLAAEAGVVRNPRAETSASGNPWPTVGKERPSWVRGTEHLCGICTLKRLWPVLFAEETREVVAPDGDAGELRRYVVSTHTMALAPLLERIGQDAEAASQAVKAINACLETETLPPPVREAEKQMLVALPRRFALDFGVRNDVRAEALRRIPAVLEAFDNASEAARGSPRLRDSLEAARRKLDRELAAATGVSRGETYYALVMVDGDRMGAWLAGGDPSSNVGRPAFGKLWHPVVRQQVEQDFGADPNLKAYLETSGVASPAYHVALSAALGDLSLHVFPYVIEQLFHGKIFYAGGDDLLAMLPVHELLPAMVLLREAYGGVSLAPDEWKERLLRRDDNSGAGGRMAVDNGFVLLDAKPGASMGKPTWQAGRLFRTLGRYATCSMGAVVAHHAAPLSSVLAELRGAERRAKSFGRNAFSITLHKRSGGTTNLTGHFQISSSLDRSRDRGEPLDFSQTPLAVLAEMQFLFAEHISRQGAYHPVAWLEALGHADPMARAPSDAGWGIEPAMLAELLSYQWRRAAEFRPSVDENLPDRIRNLAERVAAVACREQEHDAAAYIIDMIRVAEFLAREERQSRPKPRTVRTEKRSETRSGQPEEVG